MTTDDRSAAQARLAVTLARWHRLWAGRELHHVEAGPGWTKLALEGDDRAYILLSAMPGANLVHGGVGPLPPPLHNALEFTRDHSLVALLKGCRLTVCGVLPDDRIAVFGFRDPSGRPLALLHQLFGARGNLCLVDGSHRALWALHRPPHTLLARMPDLEALAPPQGPAGEDDAEPDQGLAQLQWKLAADLGGALRSRLNRLVAGSERLASALAKDLAEAEQGDEHRRRAEALATVLHLVKQGQDVLETTDPRDGSPLTIPLNPALSPAANLAAWFKRAAKSEKGRQVIQDRLENAEADLKARQNALDELEILLPGTFAEEADPLGRLAGLQAWAADHTELVPTDKPTRRGARVQEPARPFRRYRIDGRWEVWVGRSNKENDELTHRASHVKDIWLHAQGVAGSHVILRTQGRPQDVPRGAVAKAAALAALHSKAKHSTLVPVIWTERRYVRKPRKSAPGLAVCLRDQSIMVAPEVPPGAELI